MKRRGRGKEKSHCIVFGYQWELNKDDPERKVKRGTGNRKEKVSLEGILLGLRNWGNKMPCQKKGEVSGRTSQKTTRGEVQGV